MRTTVTIDDVLYAKAIEMADPDLTRWTVSRSNQNLRTCSGPAYPLLRASGVYLLQAVAIGSAGGLVDT
jgi:hypothetical protein